MVPATMRITRQLCLSLLLCLTACGEDAPTPEPEPDAVVHPEPDAEIEPGSDVVADAEPGPDSEPEPAFDAASDSEPEADAVADTVADAEADTVADAVADAEADAVADPVADAEADAGPDVPPPAQTGTIDDPILVESFPFADARDTAAAPSGVFDLYDCALETDEGGDGFVYRLEVPEAGILTASLDDMPGDGVDVDVHLLGSPDPSDCLMRDNISLNYAVVAGTYWIVVDTWVDDEGSPKAGPYTLTLELAVEGASPLGTSTNPIVVDGFPYVDARDTSESPQSLYDTYGCAPATDEGGPEWVYKVSVPSGGELSVELDDVAGDDVDVDVHLLSDLEQGAGSCVVRDNVGFSYVVEPGTWWIVVDTWVSGDGMALSGPYVVTVDFAPDAPLPASGGTVEDPIVIDALPFFDTRDTNDAPSDVFDAYSCAPGIDESGGEFVYRVDIEAAGLLQANVDDVGGDGVDVDLHLLGGPDADTCLARGNVSLAHVVEPGSYWIVVDTWVDGEGEALAGPYALEVRWVPTPKTEDYCLIVYGDTRGGFSGDPQPEHIAVSAAIDARCAEADYLHTGDFVRSGYSAADWADFMEIAAGIFSPQHTLYPVRGNHDGSWSNLTGYLEPILTQAFDQSPYAVDLGPKLSLIVLDSEEDADEQVGFLQDALAAHPEADHRFVISFHRPLYPSIGGHSGWSQGKTHWAPIFEAHADRVLVATGHNHGMSREEVGGVTYVTAGGGGAPLYGCTKVHAGTRYCNSFYGYYVCDADLTCMAWQVDPDTGEEWAGDAFTLLP